MSFTWDMNVVSCIQCHFCLADWNQVMRTHKQGYIAAMTYSCNIIRCNHSMIYCNVPFLVILYVKPYYNISASGLLVRCVIWLWYLSTSIATIYLFSAYNNCEKIKLLLLLSEEVWTNLHLFPLVGWLSKVLCVGVAQSNLTVMQLLRPSSSTLMIWAFFASSATFQCLIALRLLENHRDLLVGKHL